MTTQAASTIRLYHQPWPGTLCLMAETITDFPPQRPKEEWKLEYDKDTGFVFLVDGAVRVP